MTSKFSSLFRANIPQAFHVQLGVQQLAKLSLKL